MKEIAVERNGWRDEGISKRHRMYGWDCPCIDIDFLVCEYDKGEPRALVEYKNEKAAPQFRTHPSYQAIIKLGTRASVPVFAVRYKTDFTEYVVTPLNGFAEQKLPERTSMHERQWVTFLYELRGNIPPNELFNGDSLAI